MPEPGEGPARAARARTCSPSSSSRLDRHGALGGPGAAGHRLPGALRAVARLRLLRALRSAAGGRAGRRGALERGGLRRALAARLGARPAGRSGDEPTSSPRAPAPLRADARASCERDGIAVADCGTGARSSSSTSFPLTPDRKVHLVPRGAGPRGAARPLRLPAGSGDRALSAGADLAGDEPDDQLDPRRARPRSGSRWRSTRGDAAARGIATGDAVRVWNDLGEVRVAARLTPDLRPGVGPPAEGAVEPAAPSRATRRTPWRRTPDRPRPGRLLQRRAGGGGEGLA